MSGTRQRCRSFAARFDLPNVGALLGLWHDLGKANPQFQMYLRAAAEGRQISSVPHAVWGAALAYGFREAGGPWRELALPIAGHHAGLKAPSAVRNDIKEAVASDRKFFDALRNRSSELPMPSTVSAPDLTSHDRELRIRMLLSALVDADRLDTEAFSRPESADRRGFGVEMTELWHAFLDDQEELLGAAEDTDVNRVRREVYEACLEAARGPQGVYRLTVPTGGGKTRSGLAFALRHAVEHGLERVIVAIPYTSIIDQTAAVYREILGEDVVLEHHSRVEHWAEEGEEPEDVRLRLATQNWDAPVVVTTTVQLFESLFSHHPSAVRKIHRISNAVVLLDEIQTLPPGLVDPTTDVLRSLVEDYGTTVVLSTATQPALHETPFVQAFDGVGVDEIVPSYRGHFKRLERVRYRRVEGRPSWERIAEMLTEQPQVLAVLNTRRDALSLVEELPTVDHLFHLSSLLCGAHRRDQLERVRDRLHRREPVRVVSTQVVEAGVDIDFPVVFRALGPLDRIVQAAGRCNREGDLDRGEVFLFEPSEGGSPRGAYRTGIGHARDLLREHDLEALHDPGIYKTYFERLFRDQDLDEKDVQEVRRRMRFRDVSRRYRLIDQDTVPVVVDYNDRGHALATEWSRAPTRGGLARLQPYIVNLYRHEVEQHRRSGWAAPLDERSDLHLWEGRYDDLLGIRETARDPANLVI